MPGGTKMKTLSLINTNLVSDSDIQLLSPVNLAGTDLHLGIVEVDEPHVDPNHEDNRNFVLVKVDAFSCNYRDKALILKSALKMAGSTGVDSLPFAFFGSDFVGRIIKKGTDVDHFDIGDRVIPDCAYPEPPFPSVAPGVVTNEASKGWLRLHKSKLIGIPDFMDDEIAASYSIGGQTSTSMIRKTGVQKGEKALVLSSRSNTSMFILNGLISKGIETTALTTSDWSEDEKRLISPTRLFKIERGAADWSEYSDLGKFDVIFDPYFDLHLINAIDLLEQGGRYITCGYKNQHPHFVEASDRKTDSERIHKSMLTLTINNLSIIGNCIGTSDDLNKSIEKFDPNKFIVPVDNTYSIENGDKFIDRTYNRNTRLGKAVLIYR